MKTNEVNMGYTAINFGINKPRKQTYRAMADYYNSINDKKTSKMYKELNKEAITRLHSINTDKALDRLFSLTENAPGKVMSCKELLKYNFEIMKRSGSVILEKVKSSFIVFS